MGQFTLLEHTADVGIVAIGESLEEALAWLAKGMFSLIVDPDTVTPRDRLQVSVSSRDQQALVVDWLNELLYQYEVEGFLPKDCQISLKGSPHVPPYQGGTAEELPSVTGGGEGVGLTLKARCLGERIDPERHQILTVVKAATYHGLEVTHNGQWRIQVILDV